MDRNKKYTVVLNKQIETLKRENRYLEFKSNYQEPDKLGRYISALSNGACLDNVDMAYLYFGVDDETLSVKGTNFDAAKIFKGNQALEMFLRQMISPKLDFKIEEFLYEDEKRVVVFTIPSAKEQPTCFQNVPYVRVDSHTTDLRPYNDWMRQIYYSRKDWSWEVVEEASVDDLDPAAIKIALEGYCQRYPHLAEKAKEWDTITFLDKAKLTRNGKITKAALLLVGKEESSAYLGGMRQINWRLRSPNEPPAGEPFGLPFILSTTRVKDRIRNYRIKIYPDNSLIPAEVWKYDTRTILEAMHNAIAHQDYRRDSRIIVTEEPDRLIFESSGSFFTGSYEEYAEGKKTPDHYRNPFLVQAMVNLKMIDTQGYGIYTMFMHQKERFLPMPDYDTRDPEKVVLIVPGCVINKDYSVMLMQRSDISLTEAILLDRVQKGMDISDNAAKMLKKKKLIEGRKPHYIVGKYLAQATEQEAEYSKQKGFSDIQCESLIISALNDHKRLTKAKIMELLGNLLSTKMSDKQKANRVDYILKKMRRAKKISYHTKEKVWKLT